MLTVNGIPSGPPSYTFTPTVTQSGTLAVVTSAHWTQVGKMVDFWGRVNVTDATGAVAANDVSVSLPVTAVSNVAYYGPTGAIFDSSAAVIFEAIPRIATTTTFKFQTFKANGAGTGLSTAGQTFLGSIDFTAALGNGDILDFFLRYEAA